MYKKRIDRIGSNRNFSDRLRKVLGPQCLPFGTMMFVHCLMFHGTVFLLEMLCIIVTHKKVLKNKQVVIANCDHLRIVLGRLLLTFVIIYFIKLLIHEINRHGM